MSIRPFFAVWGAGLACGLGVLWWTGSTWWGIVASGVGVLAIQVTRGRQQ